MKNTLNRSVGMATILLLAGIGVSACSSPTPPTEVSQTASPDDLIKEAIKNKATHTPAEVSTVVDSFFATLDKETRASLDTVRNATAENQTAVIKQAYPETLAFFSKDMDEKQVEQMIVMFSTLSTTSGSVSVTLPEDGLALAGDTAIVPGENLTLTLDGKAVPKRATSGGGGLLHLSYNKSGKWDISGFDLSSADPSK